MSLTDCCQQNILSKANSLQFIHNLLGKVSYFNKVLSNSTPHSWRHELARKALLDWYSDKQHALSLVNTLLESSHHHSKVLLLSFSTFHQNYSSHGKRFHVLFVRNSIPECFAYSCQHLFLDCVRCLTSCRSCRFSPVAFGCVRYWLFLRATALRLGLRFAANLLCKLGFTSIMFVVRTGIFMLILWAQGYIVSQLLQIEWYKVGKIVIWIHTPCVNLNFHFSRINMSRTRSSTSSQTRRIRSRIRATYTE